MSGQFNTEVSTDTKDKGVSSDKTFETIDELWDYWRSKYGEEEIEKSLDVFLTSDLYSSDRAKANT